MVQRKSPARSPLTHLLIVSCLLCACSQPQESEPAAEGQSLAAAPEQGESAGTEPLPDPRAQESGPALWQDGCTHALGVYQKQSGADDAKTKRGRDACVKGLTEAASKGGVPLADKAARCFSKMSGMPDMVPCMSMLVDAGVTPQVGSKFFGSGSAPSR